MSVQVKCVDCRFYLSKDLQAGFCKRYPPIPVVIPAIDNLGRTGAQIQWSRPGVKPDDFCGEFSLGRLKAAD